MFIQKVKSTAFVITLTLSLSGQQSFAEESVQAPAHNAELSSGDSEVDILSQACRILSLCQINS